MRHSGGRGGRAGTTNSAEVPSKRISKATAAASVAASTLTLDTNLCGGAAPVCPKIAAAAHVLVARSSGGGATGRLSPATKAASVTSSSYRTSTAGFAPGLGLM